MTHSTQKKALRNRQSGSIFSFLLGAMALAATVSVMVYQVISGPLSSATRINHKIEAASQIHAVSRIMLQDAVSLSSTADCDGDGFIEPREWRTGTQTPVNGGLVPSGIGAPLTDPWGSDYGYCAWDAGTYNDPAVSEAAEDLCATPAGRLTGRDDPASGGAATQTVIAVISAGADREFQTTCFNYVTPVVDAGTESDTNLVQTAAGSDDIVRLYTYNEAASMNGLWAIKAGEPDTMTLDDKNVEVTGPSTISAVAVSSSGKTMADGGLQPGDETAVVDGACTAGNAGLIRYNSTANSGSGGLQVCDETQAWGDTGGGGGSSITPSPDAFSFTDQTDVERSAVATSNAVALSGFSGIAYAFCEAGCINIARNGEWVGTSTGFRAGDTITIQQNTHADYSTATTATVTVGDTTSGTWSATTIPLPAPDAFSFTDQTDVAPNTTITSNAVALSGFAGVVAASCGTGCTNIARNGVWMGTSAEFEAGDTIAIRQLSSASMGATTTATVIVGATTSGTWSVTSASDACLDSPVAGTACANGSIYVGQHGGVAMYITACDNDRTGTKGACSGTQVNRTRSAANTYCNALEVHSKDDWRLPTLSELQAVMSVSGAIGDFKTPSWWAYWTSTATGGGTYNIVDSDGNVDVYHGANNMPNRCIRKGP